MSSLLNVLILENRADQVYMLLHELRRSGVVLAWYTVVTEAEYLAYLVSDNDIDVVLASCALPDLDCHRVLQLLKIYRPAIPCIAITDAANELRGYAAMQAGAADYILREQPMRLNLTVLRHVQERRAGQVLEAPVLPPLPPSSRHVSSVAPTSLSAILSEIDAFSHAIGHDLRAPLRIIKQFAHMLLTSQSGDLSPTTYTYIQRIQSNAIYAQQLIDGLLTLTPYSRHALQVQPVDLAALAHQIGTDMQLEYPDHQIEFVVDALPICRGDPVLLRQMLVNLIGNAFKFTRYRTPARITISSQQREEGQVYLVRDNGAGFDMRYADKLFGLFQRLHRPEEYEGSGVGLFLVRRIVHVHGGRIWAEAEVDRGATFFFTLPRATNEPPAA